MEIEEALIAVIVSKPRVMRDMPRLLRDAQLRLVDVDAPVYADVGESTVFLGAAESYGPLVARSGLVPAERLEAWLAALRRASGRRVLRRLQLRHIRKVPVMPIVTVNGTELYCEIRGTGPPILLIMGATGDGGHFDALADLLSDEFTVVSYDRRGDGRSHAP